MDYELKAQSLYDLISQGKIEPQADYYRLVVQYKAEILFDVKLEGQVKIAEKLSNKEHNLIMTHSRLSAIMKILEVL